MKKSRFTDSQIMAILKQAEAGTPVPELCREHGMSAATFYKWRAKYGGMDASLMAPAQGAGGGEPAAEEDVRRGAAQGGDRPGGDRKKVVRPSRRREMAKQAVERQGGEHSAARAGLCDQRDLLPLSSPSSRTENARDRRLADPLDAQPAQLGLRAVLSVPAQRQRLRLEPQAGVPDLPGAGAEPAHQAEEAAGAREAPSRWPCPRRSTRSGRWTSCTTSSRTGAASACST